MQNSGKVMEGITRGIRKALIISVSDYATNLQALDFCKNDGEKMYDVLKSLGYEILDNHKLVGQVRFDTIRDAIFDFFDNTHTKADDTLLFYYSGHGIPDTDGDVYLATSEVDPDAPYRRGFSFNELTRMMNKSSSTRIVSILDCCYSGAAKITKGIGKGGGEAAAKLGTAAINDKSANMQKNKGICLLAASQAAQEAYALKEGDHSIFTYYLLEGLKGNENSVDGSGNVTADTLGKYVHKAIVNLPPEKRPKQTPIRKVEVGDEIVLAQYPKLAEKPVVDISTIIFEGNRYLNNEKYTKAVELFDEATKLNPKSYVAHSYKGYALLKLKKYDEAINSYNTALEINPKEIDALQNKGLALSNLSKHNEAIKCYNEALEVDPMNSKVWYYKGLALSQLSKYNEALKCYNEAIRINPEYSDALRDKGLALERLAREKEEKEEPAPPPRIDISLILDEGMQYFENGDYDNAIKSFDKAMSLNPKNPIPYNYKGDVFFKLKNYEEAIKCYDAALEINPKYLDVLKDKGLSLDNLGKYQEAIDCFRAALEINPKIVRNWHYKALSLSKLPNNEEAIRCYDEALRLEPNNVDAWIGRGVCLGILKRYKEAIECYDKAIAIDPNNAIAHEKKKIVLQIISEETTKSRPQQKQQQLSPVIGSLSSPPPIQSIPSPSQQQSPIHCHQPTATKDRPQSSSSVIKQAKEDKREELHYYPHTAKEEKRQQKQSWMSPKILIPIIAVAVIGSVIAFAVFSTTTTPPPETTTTPPPETTTTPPPETTTTPPPETTTTPPPETTTTPPPETTTTLTPPPETTTTPPNQPPIVNAGEHQTVNSGDTVTLDGSKSSDLDGSITYYYWDQIAGPKVVLSDPESPSPSFIAPTVSSDTQLTFTLSVKDDKGAPGIGITQAVTINVKPVLGVTRPSPETTTTPPNQPPVAKAGKDITVKEGTLVSLDASNSQDPDGDTLEYSWKQIGGQSPKFVTLNNANTAKATFTAPSGITSDTVLYFELIVKDNKGATSTDSVKVTVQHSPPPPETTTPTPTPPPETTTPTPSNDPPVAKAGKDITVKEGTLVSLDASNSQDPDGDTLEYSWKQIGGQSPKFVTLNNANTAKATFTAPSGITSDTILDFELIAKDNKGASSTDNVQVTVQHSPPPPETTTPTPTPTELPIVNAGEHQTVNSGDTVTLDGSKSSDLDGSITYYYWDQIAGPKVVLSDPESPSPSFTAPFVSSDTQLTFTLSVKDDKGAPGITQAVTITVKPVLTPTPSREPAEEELEELTTEQSPNEAPIANAGSDRTVNAGDTEETSPHKEQYSFVGAWGSEGSGKGEFAGPGGIATDSLGNVYVADSGNYRIQKFDSDGNFITEWGSEGSGKGEFIRPEAVAIDSKDNVYVADSSYLAESGNSRIQKFDSDGNFITEWGSEGSGKLSDPIALAIDSKDNVYVADSNNALIEKFTADGTFIAAWTGEGSGGFSSIGDIAVDSQDNVYVSEFNRILKFDSDGSVITAWFIISDAGEYTIGMEGIAVDPQNNVYIGDIVNSRIQKFTSDGTFITAWGSKGTGEGEFDESILGIAIDSSGNVYVCEGGKNQRIQVFAPTV